MGHQVTIGGERLGAGKRMKAYLHGYERSTHNLSYIWRSSMACGTLVPFMVEVMLPGDTFDINLDVDVLTHPTIGPLFGNYKIQLDTFIAPIRLFQGKLHMNLLEIGLKMEDIKLPLVQLTAKGIDPTTPIDNQQVNPSSIFSYLGIRGLGTETIISNDVVRSFNAVPHLMYWSIYKQYYANKQEKIGAVIHKDPNEPAVTITGASIVDAIANTTIPLIPANTSPFPTTGMEAWTKLIVQMTNLTEQFQVEGLNLLVEEYEAGGIPVAKYVKAVDYWQDFEIDTGNNTVVGTNTTLLGQGFRGYGTITYTPVEGENAIDIEPKITTFPLSNIDDVQMQILGHVSQPTPFQYDVNAPAPYGLPMQVNITNKLRAMNYGQEGLALKTYNSDLFNNWMNTEYIDGPNGIAEVTKIDTSGGSFTIDELNMSQKIYKMLNRIAISGGSYDDWQSAVYDIERIKSSENPMYMGGLIRNLVFQEVISNSRSLDQPLGTLAGRGTLGSKKKGGSVVIKATEMSYAMGIISITPNVDYSQGNKWDVNLETMDDFHKPQLDEIGFQNLNTEQLAWWDTKTIAGATTFKSAGKQPAWINYMTNVNQVRGNFAEQNQQMFMTLNRRYEATFVPDVGIRDLTTYIDPSKFNHIFADTRRDAQNFWAQIAVNITARRKMSAKIMPNL